MEEKKMRCPVNMAKLLKAVSNLIGLIRNYSLVLHPTRLVFFGYLSYIIIGCLLLCLPFAQKGSVTVLDNLFVATSAISTTGLTPVSASDTYNLFGQVVILILIQLGGVGYMTFGSFVVLSRKADLSNMRSDIGRTVFSLPKSFRIDKFIRSVIVFTLIIESTGAVLLYIIFSQAGVQNPLWPSVFHSISAFCTAGFSTFNNSLADFAGNFWLNIVIAALSYCGAIGFIVFVDCWRKATGKINRITLTSKIILYATFWLSIVGSVLIFLFEPTVQNLPVEKRLIASFFQSMTAITTVGFNTIEISLVSKASLLLIIVLMVIGASPSGTGGGLKSTTFSVIIGVMKSTIRGSKEVIFWGRKIPIERVWTAVAGFSFYIAALVIGTYLLEMTEKTTFDENLFEAASALGTVGLSTGITSGLSNLGKIIITIMMFCGRLGPLTFSIALFLRSGPKDNEKDGDLAV